MLLDKEIDPWDRDTDREKDTIDNPYVAVHQLKTHMFLLIITHTAHKKTGYFSHSKSMGCLPFILI